MKPTVDQTLDRNPSGGHAGHPKSAGNGGAPGKINLRLPSLTTASRSPFINFNDQFSNILFDKVTQVLLLFLKTKFAFLGGKL